MNKRMSFSRTQWASGQGFFHSGTVEFGPREVLYVYDCGSDNFQELTREIKLFGQRHNRNIDILFLSHFDADHVNGIHQLYRTVGRIHNVVIPLVPPAERILVLARALVSNSDYPDWYPDLIADPQQTITDLFGAESEVITVSPDDQPDPLEEDESPTEPEGGPTENRSIDGNFEPGRHSILFGADGPNRVPLWEWVPMTTTYSRARKPKFLNALASTLDKYDKERHWTRQILKERLSSPDGIRDLVENYQRELVIAYNQAFRNSHSMNLSSLLVYSGTTSVIAGKSQAYRTRGTYERAEISLWEIESGWLGTGDQYLGPVRSREVERFFDDRISRVGSLALPHHGSKNSLDKKSHFFLSLFDSLGVVCSASTGTRNKHGHPHREVVAAVASYGHHLIVINEQEKSRWTESGTVLLWQH